MNTQRKNKIVKFVMVRLLIILPIAYFSYYQFIYHPLLSFRKAWILRPIGEYQFPTDARRNAGFADHKNNMLLIITLPETGQRDCVSWHVMPKSKSFAKIYSEYGHVIGVRLHRDSFVVVDGVTGEELIVHPIEKNQPWLKMGSSPEYWRNASDNALERYCDFFFIPKEKFLEIQEKVNQHDTSNEKERGSYAYKDDRIEVKVKVPWRNNDEKGDSQ